MYRVTCSISMVDVTLVLFRRFSCSWYFEILSIFIVGVLLILYYAEHFGPLHAGCTSSTRFLRMSIYSAQYRVFRDLVLVILVIAFGFPRGVGLSPISSYGWNVTARYMWEMGRVFVCVLYILFPLFSRPQVELTAVEGVHNVLKRTTNVHILSSLYFYPFSIASFFLPVPFFWLYYFLYELGTFLLISYEWQADARYRSHGVQILMYEYRCTIFPFLQCFLSFWRFPFLLNCARIDGVTLCVMR